MPGGQDWYQERTEHKKRRPVCDCSSFLWNHEWQASIIGKVDHSDLLEAAKARFEERQRRCDQPHAIARGPSDVTRQRAADCIAQVPGRRMRKAAYVRQPRAGVESRVDHIEEPTCDKRGREGGGIPII